MNTKQQNATVNQSTTWAQSKMQRRSILARSIMVALFAGSMLPAMALAATVQGVKFNDLNGNGVKDPGEKGLANEIVNVRGASASQFWSVKTDLNGNYSLGGLDPGDYTIWTAVSPTDSTIAGTADWSQTTPEQGDFPPTHKITLTATGVVVNFGSWDNIARATPQLVVDAGGNHAVDAGDKVNYQGSFIDPNSTDKHTVVWNFGDGNSKKQVVGGDTGTRRGTRAVNPATPIQANNIPAQVGTLTTTATVTAPNGTTATDTSTTIVRNNTTDPCATGVPTVQSIKSGDWSDPNTWSPATKLDTNTNAWVIISAGTTVTLKEPPITDSTKAYTVKGLCVAPNATLTSAANAYGQPVTWVAVNATNIHNQGKIKGADGLNGVDPDGSGPKPFQHATGGSNIILRGNQLINDGSIIAGNGGTDSTWTFMGDNGTDAIGGAGGGVELYPVTITNNGLIQAGNGGVADRCNDGATLCVHGNGIGGNGGLARVMATNIAGSTNSSTGQILGGRGGNTEVWIDGSHGSAGTGGNVDVNIGVNNGTIKAGGPGSTVKVDPTTLKFGNTTRISDADNIVIFGGEDWTMELNNLSAGAISAAKTITIAVGKGGVVDLRGSAAKALKAAEKVEIFADSVVLDNGVTLQQLVETPNLVRGPAKILYSASWSGVQQIVAEPGETVPVSMALLNGGPKEDTYTLTMSHSASNFVVSEVPTDATVNSQRRTELAFEVTLPQTRGAEDVITLTATSQNDPTLKVVAEIHVGVKPAEVVTPPTTGDTTGGTTQPPQPPVTTSSDSASGIVKDESGKLIAGVTVQLDGQTTTTDANGKWQFTGLPAGEHVATFSKAGYDFGKPVQCQQDFQANTNSCYVTPPQSLLKLKVGASPVPVGQNDNLTYTLTVTNVGTETATGVVLNDVLPATAQIVSMQPVNGGSCNTQTVSCTLPELAAGASAQFKVVVKSNEVGKLANTATVSANNYPADVVASAVEVKPLLSVTASGTPSPVEMLKNLHYTYTVDLSKQATATATGVTLVSQLPSGVELQSAKTAVGDCDVSKLPTVTCALPDMKVGSQATVNLDLLLKDAGLLLLTNDVKVSAANYATHTAKERTPILVPDTLKVDLIFVIDTTNSMQKEIDGVVKALQKFLATVDPKQTLTAALVTFKDDVKVEAFTQDLTVLQGAVEKLYATGGGECPEASAEALEIALKHIKDAGTIMLATDASPYPDADLSKLVQVIKDKKVKFQAFVTGDCSDTSHWNQLPNSQ